MSSSGRGDGDNRQSMSSIGGTVTVVCSGGGSFVILYIKVIFIVFLRNLSYLNLSTYLFK